MREPYQVPRYTPGDGNRAEYAGALLGALVALGAAVRRLDDAARHSRDWSDAETLAHFRAEVLELMHGAPSPGDEGFEDFALKVARDSLPEPTSTHLRSPRYPVFE